ncbi:cbb3-type cytochrome c oxidase subunit II [Coraliomargarita algicola]|uniref:Cbb3-type cytochrome c oxidase subunit II n=1 Tax=Coraliomargarita algicola TaxID=3092156 RepID=A0ABZ0RJL6_9BACT|nr:cbb3-type cytochrome c oxidase subunit II [Coraliomargarita sp. J2-16]WPJ95727.1 cbb3-type cytochrome c oxidase subunit II [Coraliomargarita sp. J2-16]
MKNLPLLFCGIFFALAFSFTGLILSSHIQLGSLTRTTETLVPSDEDPTVLVMPEGETLFPAMPGGIEQQGKDVYISMGCIYCHTQQIRRSGFGADIDRGWGSRQTVARDYITQDRVLLGTMRAGPDLANVGGRIFQQGGRDWHHLHLYNPQITSEGSTMPPFAFLYELREIDGTASADALKFPPDSKYAPEAGYEVVPTRRAKALVEYLLSLKINYSLPEAPISE